MRSRAGPGGAQPEPPERWVRVGARWATDSSPGGTASRGGGQSSSTTGTYARGLLLSCGASWVARDGLHTFAAAAPAPSWDDRKCLQMNHRWMRTLTCTHALSSCVEDRGEGVQPGGTATVRTRQAQAPPGSWPCCQRKGDSLTTWKVRRARQGAAACGGRT